MPAEIIIGYSENQAMTILMVVEAGSSFRATFSFYRA